MLTGSESQVCEADALAAPRLRAQLLRVSHVSQEVHRDSELIENLDGIGR